MRHLTAGDVAAERGAPARILVVHDGELHVRDRAGDGEHVLHRARPGSTCGLADTLLGAPFRHDIVAGTDAAITTIARDQTYDLLTAVPPAVGRLLAELAKQLIAAEQRIAVLTRCDLVAAVAATLLDHTDDRGVPPVANLSHHLLADLVGARRQSVSRVLGALEQEGTVDLGYRRITIADQPRLRHLARDGADALEPATART
jgi:CRP-like cAMP-binding protein